MAKYLDIEVKGANPALQAIELKQIDACRITWTVNKRKKEAEDKYKEAQAKAREYKNKLKQLRSGLAGLAGAFAADLVAAIGFMASQMAAAVIGAASSAMAKIIEALLNQILKIVMAGPESLFSLIKFPLDKAILHTRKESEFLLEAQYNLGIVLRIINKYLSGMDSDIYYKSMQQALPYIATAIKDLEELIQELKVERFNQSKFENVIFNIDLAIAATVPKSVIIQKLGIDKAMDEVIDGTRQRVTSEQEAKYQQLKLNRDRKYREDIAKVKKQSTTNTINTSDLGSKNILAVGGATAVATVVNPISRELQDSAKNAKIAKIDADYQLDIEGYQRDRDYQIERETAKAQYKEMVSGRKFEKIVASEIEKTKQEFLDDMNLMKNNLISLLTNVKDAFLEYKMSQFFTGATYNSIDRIKTIMQFLIDVANKAANMTADGISKPMNISLNTLKDVELTFAKDIVDKDIIGPAKIATDLSMGNVKLEFSKAIIAGTITPSIIQMMNFDDLLLSEKQRFERFRNTTLFNIKDFRGETGMWATGSVEALGEVTVYVSLIQQIGATITNAPIKMMNKDKTLKKTMYDMDAKFDEILAHNKEVVIALSSYRPYQSGMVNQLKRYIDTVIPYLAYAFFALDFANVIKQLIDRDAEKLACQPMWNIWDKLDGVESTKTIDEKNKDTSNAMNAISASVGESADEWRPVNRVSPVDGAIDGPVPSSLGLMDNAL